MQLTSLHCTCQVRDDAGFSGPLTAQSVIRYAYARSQRSAPAAASATITLYVPDRTPLAPARRGKGGNSGGGGGGGGGGGEGGGGQVGDGGDREGGDGRFVTDDATAEAGLGGTGTGYNNKWNNGLDPLFEGLRRDRRRTSARGPPWQHRNGGSGSGGGSGYGDDDGSGDGGDDGVGEGSGRLRIYSEGSNGTSIPSPPVKAAPALRHSLRRNRRRNLDESGHRRLDESAEGRRNLDDPLLDPLVASGSGFVGGSTSDQVGGHTMEGHFPWAAVAVVEERVAASEGLWSGAPRALCHIATHEVQKASKKARYAAHSTKGG